MQPVRLITDGYALVGIFTLPKIEVAPSQLAIAAAVFIVAASNNTLFVFLVDSLDLHSLAGVGFLATIVLLMVWLLVTIFLTVGFGWLLKSVIALFVIASSVLAYFSNSLGVVFDQGMILNMAETIRDENVAEALELGSAPLLRHVFIFGVVPALLLLFVRVQPRPPIRELGVRLAVLQHCSQDSYYSPASHCRTIDMSPILRAKTAT